MIQAIWATDDYKAPLPSKANCCWQAARHQRMRKMKRPAEGWHREMAAARQVHGITLPYRPATGMCTGGCWKVCVWKWGITLAWAFPTAFTQRFQHQEQLLALFNASCSVLLFSKKIYIKTKIIPNVVYDEHYFLNLCHNILLTYSPMTHYIFNTEPRKSWFPVRRGGLMKRG